MSFHTVVLLFLILPLSVLGLDCDQCDRRIKADYFKHKSSNFCSKACYSRAVLPICSVCGYKCGEKYFQTDKGDAVCSQRCYEKLLPQCELCNKRSKTLYDNGNVKFCTSCNKLPRCFSCFDPTYKGKKTKDDRSYCRDCAAKAVFTQVKAEEIYQKAQLYHTRLTNEPPLDVPPMALLWPEQMKEKKPGITGSFSLRGLYEVIENVERTVDQRGRVVSSRVINRKEEIYLVNGLKYNDLIVTAVHELTHDWLKDFFPGLKKASLKYEEGVCQYLSHVLCLKKKWLKTAKNIETAKDPIYGDGFRFFHNKFGDDNWKGVVGWLREQGYNKP